MFHSYLPRFESHIMRRLTCCLVISCALASAAPGEPPERLVSVSSSVPATQPNPAGPKPPTLISPASAIELQGITKPKRDALLSAPTSGLLSAVHVSEGSTVRTGDALVTLDDRVARAAEQVAQITAQSDAAIRQATVAHREALEILQRAQVAFQRNASSEFEVAAKRSRVDQAQAEVELQQQLQEAAIARWRLATAERESLTLKAPFDGEVIEIRAESGNSASANEPLIRVAQLDELRVDMHLPLMHFGTLKSGQTVPLHVGAPVNRTVSANVGFVSPVVEPTSESFRVVLHIPNDNRAIPAGTQVWFGR